MYKKSLVRIETENRSDLSNPALNDIIATNHVIVSKNTRKERLSRACKAAVLMITLGFVAIGIVILTVAIAHSRNTLNGIISRTAEKDFSVKANNSRTLFINQENWTTITNEQTENEYLPKTTVILTSNNLHMLSTENVHMSSSIMSTKQNENISPDAQTMKTYPSLSTIVNEESSSSTTAQKTISNQESTSSTTAQKTISNQESTSSTTIQTTVYNQETTLVPTSQQFTKDHYDIFLL
ncbi:unnamed protein product [Rotaria magnacalcarata]|uniref:Uncharacterized protein n=1 Tax=Rotaria magnacalcarata TaxID=392030 RepID=A0A8S2J1Z8_9BILA|nr:unnamed protein product [Rotaria magnacalcarata]